MSARHVGSESSSGTLSSSDHISLTEQYAAHNYAPLDVVLTRGEGAWVWDVEGKRYLDMLAAYSAVTFGHCNPRITRAAEAQLRRVTLTSRAFYTDQTGLASKELAELCDMDSVLFMNSGAEAVETAIKLARRWGYEVKGVPPDSANIVVCSGNFHGRTVTIISGSDSALSRTNFGPYTPGFSMVPYGDSDALRAAVGPNTVAVLFEPIQGEGGIIIPPDGYLRAIRKICSENGALMLADEIQTGLCRTGEVFGCDHEAVKPDVYILGKSLGGAITPISAVVTTNALMKIFTPGSHGSTFGGNPFACAVAREVIKLIREEQPQKRSKELGAYLLKSLKALNLQRVTGLRGRGLFVGIDIDKKAGKAKPFCHHLKDEGVLCKDTREQTIRLAPPLVIEKSDLDWAIERVARVLGSAA